MNTTVPSSTLEAQVTATAYRTHTCADLNVSHINQQVTLSGWVHSKRDHGGLIFLDLRDHYGVTQCVLDESMPDFALAHRLSLESVVQVVGRVIQRSPETCNANIPTGEIEIALQKISLLSAAQPLPLPVNSEEEYPEDVRLAYRFLDLRRKKMHDYMTLRSSIISFLRDNMTRRGFLEIQTPILTATSPEGARDYVVPSRYAGLFYALPQAPQQFKQLLMTAGFDKYFQIAPCFRDESSRADRSPGEFYQLDMEMAFVDQEDVWNALEPVLHETFCHFAPHARVSAPPFKRIPYQEALLRYGSDKPDLRNPLEIQDYTKHLCLSIFEENVRQQYRIHGIAIPASCTLSRKMLENAHKWSVEQGAPGLGYVARIGDELKGPLAKFCDESQKSFLLSHMQDGATLFLVCLTNHSINDFMGKLRTYLGQTLELIAENEYAFCWITDFPMYETDEMTGQIIFSHNPFSMPQGGMEALCNQDPLTIKAYQYDIVCNGIELSSGAIRNHLPEVMYKAFEIAGYNAEHVNTQFKALIHAFRYGAPPHGGSAPGIDRMVMLLAGAPNIREIIPFPLNQQAKDLMMGAPSPLSAKQLKELHLSITKDKA